MWTRAALKSYAKDFLRKHYWKAFLVCLIVLVLTGDELSYRNSSSNNQEININPGTTIEEMIEGQNNEILNTGYRGLDRFVKSFGLFPLRFFGMGIFFFMVIAWIIVTLFLNPLLEVGKNRFFLNGFKGDIDMKYLASTFNKEEFWSIFKCMFVTGVINFLWYLLLIIPGIIKSYEYRFVPYLLTNEPDLTFTEAISRSQELTAGEKWNMFVLDLSFIGWFFLGSLLFGIGGIFVNPYYEATIARLYNVLSGNDNNIDDDRMIIYE